MRSLTSSAISCRIAATRGSAHHDTGSSRSSAAGSPPPNNSRMRSCSPASLDCPRSSPAPLRDKRGIPGSSVARCIMRMPRTLNTLEHSEAPLSSLPIRMTIGRRRRAAGRAKAPLRISPIRRADAAIPSSIATANLLRPPEPLLWVLPWPPPPGRVPLFYPGLARSVNTVPGDASLCCAGGKRARGLEPRLHLGAPPLVLCPASL